MVDLLAALGLAIALEGLIYALFPRAMKRMMVHVLGQPDGGLRLAGLVAAVIGVVIVWVVRG